MNELSKIKTNDIKYENSIATRKEFRKRQRVRKIKKRIKKCNYFLIIIIIVLSGISLYKNKGDNISQTSGNLNPSASPVQDNALNNQENETLVVATPKSQNEVYKEFYYYEKENQSRYEEYHKKNPDMKAEDVVWKVNVNLDKPWYSGDIITDGYETTILVNKYNKVPDGYSPPDLVKADGILMRSETAEAYKMMKKDAQEQGLSLRAVSAYRTVEYQKGLYNKYLETDSKENVDRYSARPGHSEHHTGMAIDVFGSVDGLRNFVDTPEYLWVRDNCHKYGFIIRYWTDIENVTGYEDEPWHLRYVGQRVSVDMKNKGILAYEEYYEKFIKHKPTEQ